MPSLLIRGGRVLDPASGFDAVADVAIEGDRIGAIGAGLSVSGAIEVIDAEGLIVAPGLIDPHVHLREPGQEERETIASGSAAAVMGGFTTVCCMPNTQPALDTASMVRAVLDRALAAAKCRVFPIGAVSKGRKGEELAEIALMARVGAAGFSDDGDVVASAGLMRKALGAVRATGLALMQHCQEPTMTRGAAMHAGAVSMRLGLVGWPREAEEVIVERDVRLARAAGARYHVQHISSAGSVEIVRMARADAALRELVTAEATPHHMLLTDAACESGPRGAYDTMAKMNPPLRTEADAKAIREAVAEGVITVLGTDHAPHTPESKATDFASASFGIVGLETALGLYAKALIEPGLIDWPRLIELMTVNPARLCGLDRRGLGRLEAGGPADVTIIDPDLAWTVRAAEFAGKGRNTPFEGWEVRGRAVGTIVAGRRVWEVKSGASAPA